MKLGDCLQFHRKAESLSLLVGHDKYRQILAHQDLSARHTEGQHKVALH